MATGRTAVAVLNVRPNRPTHLVTERQKFGSVAFFFPYKKGISAALIYSAPYRTDIVNDP